MRPVPDTWPVCGYATGSLFIIHARLPISRVSRCTDEAIRAVVCIDRTWHYRVERVACTSSRRSAETRASRRKARVGLRRCVIFLLGRLAAVLSRGDRIHTQKIYNLILSGVPLCWEIPLKLNGKYSKRKQTKREKWAPTRILRRNLSSSHGDFVGITNSD